jgi:hypothetical protein
MKNTPLILPAQLPRRFFEYAVTRDPCAARFIDEPVVQLEHRKMHLRHQRVRVIARVANHCNAFDIPLQVCALRTE